MNKTFYVHLYTSRVASNQSGLWLMSKSKFGLYLLETKENFKIEHKGVSSIKLRYFFGTPGTKIVWLLIYPTLARIDQLNRL